MSQSLGNYVGITEPPDEHVRQADVDPRRADRAVPAPHPVDCDPDEVDALEPASPDGSLHPVEQKRAMAREVVDLYHGAGAGERAEERFDRVHRDRELPEDVPEVADPAERRRRGRPRLASPAARRARAGASNGEARRRIEQGGVRSTASPSTDPAREFDPEELRGKVLQVGRRWFAPLA